MEYEVILPSKYELSEIKLKKKSQMDSLSDWSRDKVDSFVNAEQNMNRYLIYFPHRSMFVRKSSLLKQE